MFAHVVYAEVDAGAMASACGVHKSMAFYLHLWYSLPT